MENLRKEQYGILTKGMIVSILCMLVCLFIQWNNWLYFDPVAIVIISFWAFFVAMGIVVKQEFKLIKEGYYDTDKTNIVDLRCVRISKNEVCHYSVIENLAA